MSVHDIEAMLKRSLEDPRVLPATRARAEKVLTRAALDPGTLTEFCAQALVLARSAAGDTHAHDTVAWLSRLTAAVLGAPAPTHPAAPAQPAVADHPATPAGGSTLAEAWFSPGDGPVHAIQNEFARARHTADVCVFTITDDRISDALLQAHHRGVEVRVITDDEKSQDEGSDIERFRRAGIPVEMDASEHHMHHKFAVFDGVRVLTGSYNWTRSAGNFNQENVVISDDPRLVTAFAHQFEALWKQFG